MVPQASGEAIPLRLRRSARVFLFDPAGDVFLIRFVAERDGQPWIFWVTPGGEIEPDEPELEAAARELFEELGIRPELFGPVHVESGSEYVHLGERVRNHDTFFAAVCGREEPALTGVTADEIRLMREARWFRPAELAGISEPVFPPRLPMLAPKIFQQLSRSANPRKEGLSGPSCG